MRRFQIAALCCLLAASACSDSSGPDDDEVTTIEMRNGNVFSPASPTIAVGASIRWVNQDDVAHNSTSVPATLWSSGNLQPGGSYRQTFTSPGTYAYECTIHPGMSGTITVL